MNVKEIVAAKLKELGADGLCTCECGCGLDDLMPCENECGQCVPAKRAPCKDCPDKDACEFEAREDGYCYKAMGVKK